MQAIQVFSELEVAHYGPWVRAAQDHGLRLEWEQEQRVPRLAGLVRGVGVRVSWMAGGGARVTLLPSGGDRLSLELDQPRIEVGLVKMEVGQDRVVLTLQQDAIPQLSGVLTQAFLSI